MKRFNPSSSWPARAVQCWQILVAKAMNRQTLTYEEISKLMFGKDAAGVLSQILTHVAYYCQEHEMPLLTAIVVRKHGGEPGPGIPADIGSIDEQREKVYGFDWFDLWPPSEADLDECYKARSAK